MSVVLAKCIVLEARRDLVIKGLVYTKRRLRTGLGRVEVVKAIRLENNRSWEIDIKKHC
jgi:hypothetical protein